MSKKSLFNEYETYTEDATEVQKEAYKLAGEFFQKYGKEYYFRDLKDIFLTALEFTEVAMRSTEYVERMKKERDNV